jgi:cysteine desulfuration protein SufE
MDMQTITEAFELIDSWEERFEMVSDLGHQLLPIADSERIDANRVPGCETKTWLTGSLLTGDGPLAPDTIEFRADAETPLVRGLVALLLMPYQGRTPQEVLETDPNAVFGPLHLEEALSAKRRAGMEAFIDRVRRIAKRLETA